MQPKLAFAIRADYDGRWTNQVINDANKVARGVQTAGATMNKSLSANTAHTANLAAQFNDIGVTLASGQSPFTIALQQGTQVAQVLGPMGLVGSVKALGTAFMTLLSPVTLITIATIGLGAAAIQWAMSVAQGGETADEALKKHKEWLDVVLVGYDSAADAADKYLTEAKKLPQGVLLSDLGASMAEQKKALEQQQEQVERFRRTIEDTLGFIQQMQDIASGTGGDSGELGFAAGLLKGLGDLDISADSSRQELEAAMLAARKLFHEVDDPSIKDRASEAFDLANNLRLAKLQAEATLAAIGAISFPALPSSYTDALAALKDLGVKDPTDREKATSARDQGLNNAQDTVTRTAVLKEYNAALARIETRDAEEEALKRSKEFASEDKRHAESLRTVMDTLALETESLGLNAIEQDKLNRIRSAGVDSASAEAQAIRDGVDALYMQRDALEIVNSMKTPSEVAEEELARLGELLQARAIDWDEYAWAANKAMATVAASTGAMVGKVGDILGSMASIMQASGEKGFGVAKGLSVAMAVLKGYEAVTSAYAAGAAIPGGGPITGALYAAAAAAATAAQIANIMSTTSSSTSMNAAGAGGAGGASAAPQAPQATPGQGLHIELKGKASDSVRLGDVESVFAELQDWLGVQGKQLVVTYKGA